MKTTAFAQVLSLTALVFHLGGCSTLPPGAHYPKIPSIAYAEQSQDRVAVVYRENDRVEVDRSAFRMLSVGADGFATRIQMAQAAHHSLDLQYFIFTADSTGLLLSKAVLAAADRGVRVRILVDDGSTVAGDEQIQVLSAHPHIEVRVFNPFYYRGHISLFKAVDFAFEKGRVDYRMHNKLFVADNSIALVGGRNVGDEYFQVSPEAQYADDDIFVGGPLVRKLSATFDQYWNSSLSIPAQALIKGASSPEQLERRRASLNAHWRAAEEAGADYLKRADGGEPLAGMLSGQLPLIWSQGTVVCDSPDKKQAVSEGHHGRLLYRPIAEVLARVRSEFLMITPYLVPTRDELELLKAMRARNVRVRILTNSLNSTNQLSAHSGYMHYRRQLLEEGVELYEVRSLLGATSRGTGQKQALSRYGNYGLHGKLLVFDRNSMYAGSMNFDKRSRLLNTEIGVVIDSPELAAQTAARFEAMTQPASAYAVSLRPGAAGKAPVMVWRTLENEKPVEYTREPSNSFLRRVEATVLSLLPIEREL
jgi:putative cardiolipin synthase